MWEAEDALGHAAGTSTEIEAAEIALGRAEFADQRAGRELAAWARRNGGFLSPAAMYKTLCAVSVDTSVARNG
jgi:hypothetical protein